MVRLAALAYFSIFLLEGNRTQALWSQSRRIQFWGCAMGVADRKGTNMWLENFELAFVLLCAFLVYTYVYLLCFTQIPYEYLTPLQAAIGVVQKVMFLLFDFLWRHMTILVDCTLLSHHMHVEMHMHKWYGIKFLTASRVCDQPYPSTLLLNLLICSRHAGSKIQHPDLTFLQ